ncbi:hypothetical protein ACFLTS_01605 [Chloroflexota bacterium]
MLKTLIRWLLRRRKYPIKRDQWGQTARRRAFELFDDGERPAKVAPMVGISKKTAYGYFQQWKKRSPKFESRYQFVRSWLKENPEHSESLLLDIAWALKMPVGELKAQLEEPWGLKRLMMNRIKPDIYKKVRSGERRRWTERDAERYLRHVFHGTNITEEGIEGWMSQIREKVKELKSLYKPACVRKKRKGIWRRIIMSVRFLFVQVSRVIPVR